MKNSTTRFSDRVENYIRYRPGYPVEVIETLKKHCQLTADSIVADVGSGTGILTRLFLDHGNRVFAVEPNADMRKASEELLVDYENFVSKPGTAEATGLDAASMDHVVAGQAFHWFDRDQAKTEFFRILKPGGWAALIWNERLVEASPFLIGYEALLNSRAGDYQQVDHRNIDETVLRDFFAPGKFEKFTFANSQTFDYDGLRGRALSSSYVPNVGSPGHDEFFSKLKNLFEEHHENGAVKFEYQTILYCGLLQN